MKIGDATPGDLDRRHLPGRFGERQQPLEEGRLLGGGGTGLRRGEPVGLQIAAGFGEGKAVVDSQPGDRPAGQGQRLQASYDLGGDLGGRVRHRFSG